MVRVSATGLQEQSLSRRSVARRGGRISAAPVNHGLHHLGLGTSVIGAFFLSVVGVAVSQTPTPSLPAADTRMQAPIGHRQPRPSDLPPSIQRDEELTPPSVETQPSPPAQTQPAPPAQAKNQPPNRRSSALATRAGNVPTVDIRKSCQMAEKDVANILGPNNGITVGTCLKQEDDARQQMVNNWATYPQTDKQRCINTTGYLPSYVEWLTCLEMYRDVKSIDNTTGRGGAITR
ncbi:MAG TPA: hypothetical protein VH684_24795 [Xanthobacteraceae bacterium]